MKNSIDIVYIALELVKTYLTYTCTCDVVIQRSEVTKLYKETICDLLDIEKLPDVMAIEEENKRLKEELDTHVFKLGLPAEDVDVLLDLLNRYKGDMEPEVYNSITYFIQSKLKPKL